jgi:hypothetical protein
VNNTVLTVIAELELAINILERIKYQVAFPLMVFNGCSVKIMETPSLKLQANRKDFISAREQLNILNVSLPILPVEKYNNLARYNETKEQLGYFKLIFNRISYWYRFDDSLAESSKLVSDHINKVLECKKSIGTLESLFAGMLADHQSSRGYHCSMSCHSPSLLCNIVAEVSDLTRYLARLISKVNVYKHVCILPDGEMYEAKNACKSVYVIMEKITLLGMKPNS